MSDLLHPPHSAAYSAVADPDILKYFHEEPALLEAVTADANPDARRRGERVDLPNGTTMPLEEVLDTRDAYRGYLAGTNRADDRVGVTTLRSPEAFAIPLIETLGQGAWARYTEEHTAEALNRQQARRVLRSPARTAVLVSGASPADTSPVPPDVAERMGAAAGRDRRRKAGALRALLETVHVAFFPEPAHDGYDWSFFSMCPIRERLVAAFREHPVEGTRRFVLPYQKARSESKFYFEKWQLTESSLPDYIEEV